MMLRLTRSVHNTENLMIKHWVGNLGHYGALQTAFVYCVLFC